MFDEFPTFYGRRDGSIPSTCCANVSKFCEFFDTLSPNVDRSDIGGDTENRASCRNTSNWRIKRRNCAYLPPTSLIDRKPANLLAARGCRRAPHPIRANLSTSSTGRANVSKNSQNFDTSGCPVDAIDISSGQVENRRKSRHVGPICRRHRHVARTCRWQHRASTGRSNLSPPSTRRRDVSMAARIIARPPHCVVCIDISGGRVEKTGKFRHVNATCRYARHVTEMCRLMRHFSSRCRRDERPDRRRPDATGNAEDAFRSRGPRVPPRRALMPFDPAVPEFHQGEH